MDQDLILIDGTQGGGQVLRTALSLSMITGRAFRMTGIRGKRSVPDCCASTSPQCERRLRFVALKALVRNSTRQLLSSIPEA